jgi:hypothetical protein
MAAECKPIRALDAVKPVESAAVRNWTPHSLYEAKPWVLIAVGVAAFLGMTVWSLIDGLWTAWRSLSCVGGAGVTVAGGAMLQLRRDYRSRSKWFRESRR